MALSDKDIIITPNRGQSADPKIEFKGASAALGPQTIALNVYPTNNGTLSFEGSAGQLFSVTNNMTGTIYSVNDISGIPSIEVLDTGLVKLAQYSGNVAIGAATTVANEKLYVNGKIRNGSVWINNGDDNNAYNENIRLFNAPNGVSVIAFSASGVSGTPTTSLLGYSDRLETRLSDAWQQRIYSGYAEAAGSYRAPIFYDSNNTGYYVDPASTSVLHTLSIASAVTSVTTFSNASDVQIILDGAGTSWAGISWVDSSGSDYIYYNGSNSTFAIGGGGSNVSGKKLHVNGGMTIGASYAATSNPTNGLNVQGATRLNTHLEIGDDLGYPNVNWSYGGSSSGMVIFYLPGTTSNYGMVHMVFDIYEYNSPRIATVIIGGHNWNGGWYSNACNVIGYTDKSVRLGVKDGRYCVVFGTSSSSWSYGTIILRKIHNGGYYSNVMDMIGDWSTTQTTTESFTYVSSDLRELSTPRSFIAYGDVRSPIYYDLDNTGYYLDPTGSTSLRTVGDWRADSSAWTGEFAGKIQYHSNNWYFQFSGEYIFRNAGGSNVFYGDNAGNTWAVASSRAPIFYDSNNTSYYVDPASTSYFNLIRANNWLYLDQNYGHSVVGAYSASRLQGVFAMGDSYKLPADGTNGGTLYGIAWSHPNAGSIGGANNLASHGMLILENGAFKGAWGGGSLRTPGDVRGTIFYDWDNTAYFIDPAGSGPGAANLNGNVTTSGNVTASQYYVGGWFRNNTSNTGLYNEITTQHLSSGVNGSWDMSSTTTYCTVNFYTGGHVSAWRGGVLADTNNHIGFVNNSGSWRLRVVGGDYSLVEGSSMRAPIFYDSDDTTVRWTAGTFVLRSSDPTIYFRDTDHNSAMIHVNSNIFYVLRGGNDTESWSQVNGVWPLEINLTNNNALFGGALNVIGAITQNSNQVLHAGNYTSYSPSLTGTGASGTWSISITGSAGQASSLVTGNSYQVLSLGVNTAASGTAGEIRATNNITAYYSDDRLKHKLGSIKNALEKVLSLNGFYYEANEVAQQLGYKPVREVGVSAQEVQKVLPEIVKPAPIDEKYLTIHYERLIPLMIEAIKEQQRQIEELSKKLEN